DGSSGGDGRRSGDGGDGASVRRAGIPGGSSVCISDSRYQQRTRAVHRAGDGSEAVTRVLSAAPARYSPDAVQAADVQGQPLLQKAERLDIAGGPFGGKLTLKFERPGEQLAMLRLGH